ncbi:MAG: hypothetical protein E7J78_00365 [Pantoea sp.]|nr:hypothetical protein [Pantoea sp.]VXC44219.1 conserved hypothetical protein [Pantoea brenneri]
MFLLNCTWRGCLDKAAAYLTPATYFLLRTLVIHPVILGVLLFIWISGGNIGDGLLKGAEQLVRDAPAGHVWICAKNADAGVVLSVPETTPECHRQAVPQSLWVDKTNRALVALYKTSVLFSLISSVATWFIRHRALAR